MRIQAFTLLTSVLILGGMGCQSPAPSESRAIATSFEALRLIIEQVAGEGEVSALLREGISPHAYSPRPSEMVSLRAAELVVFAHPHVDGWMSGMGARQDLALFAETADDTEPGDSDAHDHRAEEDPHRWNDPDAVVDALPRLTDALCDTRPDRCPAARRRASVFATQLVMLRDSLLSARSVTIAKGGSDRCFVTAQPFMDQFLRRFEIAFVGPLSVSADVEPSPTSLSRRIQEANDQGCRHLIVQSALENRLEQRLAAEQGWELIEVDPLGYGAPSYQQYLVALFDALMPTSDLHSTGGSTTSAP